jgi:hypothetical protein
MVITRVRCCGEGEDIISFKGKEGISKCGKAREADHNRDAFPREGDRPLNCGREKVSDILFSKEGKGHAKGAKTYTPEFKRKAVRLAQTSGKPIAQVARKLGISDTSIHQWRKELVAQRNGCL